MTFRPQPEIEAADKEIGSLIKTRSGYGAVALQQHHNPLKFWCKMWVTHNLKTCFIFSELLQLDDFQGAAHPKIIPVLASRIRYCLLRLHLHIAIPSCTAKDFCYDLRTIIIHSLAHPESYA